MKNKNAIELGKLAKGKEKHFSLAERRQRAVRLGQVRFLRWRTRNVK